jgi:hypothetical protein
MRKSLGRRPPCGDLPDVMVGRPIPILIPVDNSSRLKRWMGDATVFLFLQNPKP